MKKLFISTFTVVAVSLFLSLAAFGQNLCSKPGDSQVKIHVRNATDKKITVNFVDDACKESASDDQIEPGREFSGETTSGGAFRVREVGSGRVLREFVAGDSGTTVNVGEVVYGDPRTGFIQTLNRVRRGRGLPEMEYSDQLNQACQWFADHMAKYDRGGHDAVEVGGASFASMQHPWMRTSHFGYQGDAGTEATSEGEWENVNLIGADAMLGWSSSNTHYRPFLAMDGQEFKNVGFAYAKSQKKPGYYYACAVFGNPADKPGDGGGAQSEKPEGLKFTALKFFTGASNYGTSFNASGFDDLKGEFEFENPTSAPFTIQIRKYLNGKMIGTAKFDDLKGSGAMEFTVSGEAGKRGGSARGQYKIEVVLNGEVLISSEASVK